MKAVVVCAVAILTLGCATYSEPIKTTLPVNAEYQATRTHLYSSFALDLATTKYLIDQDGVRGWTRRCSRKRRHHDNDRRTSSAECVMKRLTAKDFERELRGGIAR